MSDDKSSEPPGAVSDQNAEEPPAPGGGEGVKRSEPSETREQHGEEDEGASGEGTQSTGHPESAG